MFVFNIGKHSWKLKGLLSFFITFFTSCALYASCHIHTSIPGKWEKIKTPAECALAKKILKWKSLEDKPDATFEEIKFFYEKNPDWPNQIALKRKAELAIDDSVSSDVLLAWFRKNPPSTHRGALAFAKVAEPQDHDAVKKVFTKVTLSKDDLKRFLEHTRRFLKSADIYDRFHHLMTEERMDEAQMLIPLLPQNYRNIAEERILLAKGQHRPKLEVNNPGYLWQYAKYLRKAEKNDELKRFLSEEEVSNAESKQPELWWNERKILARRFIEKKHYRDAYNIVQGAQVTHGIEFAESKWLEGWLNLRFLGNARKAYQNFQELYDKVETAISLSKAAYWAGRASEEIKDHKNQKEWLRKASKHLGTFYGQLAHSMLDEEPFKKEDFVISKQEQQAFNQNELVRAIRLLKKVGNIELTELFFWKLAIKLTKPDDHQQLINLASEVAGSHAAVQVTKIGAKHVMPVMEQAYPRLDRLLVPPLFDSYDVNMQALVHAIIRQESRFKSKAVSNRGAKGLMQILDGTAKQIARTDKIKYGSIFDPKSNIALGEAYLRGLLKRYNGSLILAIAAYNAGPHRVDKWVKEYGYPGKSGKIEAIEWIQLIPFHETRNYVERVLENYWRYTISFKGLPIKEWHKKLF